MELGKNLYIGHGICYLAARKIKKILNFEWANHRLGKHHNFRRYSTNYGYKR